MCKSTKGRWKYGIGLGGYDLIGSGIIHIILFVNTNFNYTKLYPEPIKFERLSADSYPKHQHNQDSISL